MTIDLPVLVIALAVSAPVAAQAQNPPGERTADQRADHAKERCTQNHGVDCDKPDGLKEWLLQERSRREAVRDGSRHPLPPQPGPATSRSPSRP